MGSCEERSVPAVYLTDVTAARAASLDVPQNVIVPIDYTMHRRSNVFVSSQDGRICRR